MDLFATLVKRLRPGPPAPESTEQPAAPPTLEELHGLLDRMVVERAGAEATILGAPSQRDALLDQPGTDKAIRKLDADVETAHLAIERLDRMRPELDMRIGAATVATRAEAWATMRSRLVEQITVTAGVMAAAEEAFYATCNLRLEAQRAGFVHETTAMPYHVDIHRANAGLMMSTRRYIAAQPLVVPVEAVRLWNVRFLAFTIVNASTPGQTAYLAGQEAGFPAAEAWTLVDAGHAEWPDPRTRAPKPRKRKRGEKPAAVSEGEARKFGSGPVDAADEARDGGRRQHGDAPTLHDTIGAPAGLWGDRSHKGAM